MISNILLSVSGCLIFLKGHPGKPSGALPVARALRFFNPYVLGRSHSFFRLISLLVDVDPQMVHI